VVGVEAGGRRGDRGAEVRFFAYSGMTCYHLNCRVGGVLEELPFGQLDRRTLLFIDS
jgi:hypothetical protein